MTHLFVVFFYFQNVAVTMVLRNGYSDEFLDEVAISNEPNGNIPSEMSMETVNSDILNVQNGAGKIPGIEINSLLLISF